DSSSFVNGRDFIRSHGSSMCSGFQPGYQSRNWSTGTISAMVMTPSNRCARYPSPDTGCERRCYIKRFESLTSVDQQSNSIGRLQAHGQRPGVLGVGVPLVERL